jgi:protein ImuB
MYVCVWSPAWSIGEGSGAEAAGPALAELAPRLRVEREVVWADGRGLDAGVLAGRLLDHLSGVGVWARAGVAVLPVAAELGARWGDRGGGAGEGPVPFLVKERTGWGWRKEGGPARTDGAEGSAGGGIVRIGRGEEARWLASLPVAALCPDAGLKGWLDGVGIQTIGELAALEREAVEVRFGPEAVDLWRLARGDDRRILFEPVPPARPHAAIDFVDYVLTDPARLLFTVNALLGPLCERLVGGGEHARTIGLTLHLANGEFWERTIRPARPTASRESWLRLIRGVLDRLTVPDAVAGLRLEVGVTEPAAVRQGDLFDRGFATATAVEAAVARLVEREMGPVAPSSDVHPLVERRTDWRAVAVERITAPTSGVAGSGARRAGLTLQLLPEPKRLLVESARRRDHEVPVRLRDRSGWREVAMVAGPDRVSGGRWEADPYAREYYRCVTDEGVLLWVFRDGREGSWYLHGWWD